MSNLTNRQSDGLAAALSFFVPGFGHIYKGHWIWAIVWLIITPGFWLGTGGTIGLAFHFIAAYHSYKL
jgi:TM2 domain-containing membrane protein YozV